MRVILFGATGMVGQGVLRECLLDPDVKQVLAVGRSATGQQHEKLREQVHADLFDLSPMEKALTGYQACFFCLGVASIAASKRDYAHVTYDLTMAVARTLAKLNPDMTFVYVSGAGTDSSERGRIAWARVKGKTENELLRLPFKDAYMFRPGFIQPLHGIKSRTRLYRVIYAVAGPLYPVLRILFPALVTTTEKVGKAMLRAARDGAPERVLGNRGINTLADTR